MNKLEDIVRRFTTHVAAFLLLGYLLFGFQQMGYEGVFSQLMNGAFTAHQDYPIYGYLSHFLTFRLYLWLGSAFPFLVWSSVIIIGIMLLSIAVFSMAVERQVKLSIGQSLWLAFVLVFFFLRQAFFELDLPAYAMLICSLSLLALLLLDEQKKTNRWLRWVAVFTYGFGLLTRIEVALPATALMLLLHFLLYKNAKTTIAKFWPCLLLFAGMVLALKVDFVFSNDYHKRLEPWAEPALSRANGLVPLSTMRTERDSARYIAATQLVYDDTVQLHETFLRSIIAPLDSYSNSTTIIQNAYSRFIAEAANINGLFWLLVFLFVVQCLYLAKLNQRLLVALIYFVCLGAGLFLVATIAINSRFIAVVITFALLQLFVVFYTASPTMRPKLNVVLIYVMALLSGGAAIANAIHQHKKLKQQLNEQQSYFSQLQNQFEGKRFIFDLNIVNVLYVPCFEPINRVATQQILLHDCVHEMHMKHWRTYFEQQCDCNAYDWSSVYSYFYKNRDDMVFISTPGRIALKEAFLQKVYNQNYTFEKLSSPMFVSVQDSVFCYVLSSKK
jgi:hypothetical protein